MLTHGVGPMRTYRIGATLLDIDDPTTIIGQLRQPLLSPATDEQDGYVPNVVYSCGALVHADTLVLPYGIGDAAIGIATVPLPELLAATEFVRTCACTVELRCKYTMLTSPLPGRLLEVWPGHRRRPRLIDFTVGINAVSVLSPISGPDHTTAARAGESGHMRATPQLKGHNEQF